LLFFPLLNAENDLDSESVSSKQRDLNPREIKPLAFKSRGSSVVIKQRREVSDVSSHELAVMKLQGNKAMEQTE
jgi:hypothetical protein